MPQVAPFFIIKSQVVPFFIVTWPPNLFSSDTFKGISGPDSDSKLAPNIIDKYKWYNREKACDAGKKKCRPQSHVSHRNGGTALWYFDREVVNKAKSGQLNH